MDLSGMTLFGASAARLGWLNQRQGVLAQNIANSDTPNYRPNDLKPLDFRAALRGDRPSMGIARTDMAHIASTKRDTRYREAREREPYEVAPAGNAVIMEEQLMKMNETAMDQRLATDIYWRYVGMMRIALGVGGR